MSADPADVAKYTSDGVVVTAPADPAVSDALKTTYVDARGAGDSEIDMPFRSAVVAQAMLNEKFGFASRPNAPHEGVEVEESLGLGTVIPVAPSVPCFRAVHEKRALDETLRTRAFAHDLGTDRYSVELH